MNAVRRFQSVALVVTGGAVAYYYFASHADRAGPAREDTSVAAASGPATRKAHTLTGEVVDKDKQASRRFSGKDGHVSKHFCATLLLFDREHWLEPWTQTASIAWTRGGSYLACSRAARSRTAKHKPRRAPAKVRKTSSHQLPSLVCIDSLGSSRNLISWSHIYSCYNPYS